MDELEGQGGTTVDLRGGAGKSGSGMTEEQAIRTVDDLVNASKELKRVQRSQGERVESLERMGKELSDAVRVVREAAANREREEYDAPGEGAIDARRYMPDALTDAPRKHEEGSVLMIGREVEFSYGTKRFRRYVPGYLDDRPQNDQQAQVQRLYRQRLWARMLTGNRPTPRADADLAWALRSVPGELGKRIEASIDGRSEHALLRDMAWGPVDQKRIFTDSSGAGGEWIPDRFLPTLYRPFEIESVETAGIQVVPHDGPQVIPVLTVGARPVIMGRRAADDNPKYTPSTPSTSDKTLSYTGLVVRMVVDRVSAEDSALMVADIFRDEGARALRDGFAEAWISGDLGTHQDTGLASMNTRSRWGASGLGTSEDHRRYMLGLRARAADLGTDTDRSGAATPRAAFLATLGALGEHAAGNAVARMSPEYVVNNVLSDSSLLTVDAAGPLATVIAGLAGTVSWFGVKLSLTRWLGQFFAATGLFTGSGAKDMYTISNDAAFRMFETRGVVVEVQVIPREGVIEIVMSVRRTIDTLEPTSSTIVASAFNL